MPLTDPVPSSAFDVLERNTQDTDKFVNQESGTFTNRVGKVIKPIPVIEAEANAAIASLGWDPVGEFAAGFTYAKLNDVGRDVSGSWWRYNGEIPSGGYVVEAGTVPSSPDFSVISFETAYNVQWKSGQSVGDALDETFLPRIDILSPAPLGRDYRFQYRKDDTSLRIGISDATPLDDPSNHFRGLYTQDSWGDSANIGNGSVSFGRNGASFAYLSATWGHDCVTYGTASFSGGAGSATGNPDFPLEDAIYGYCSFSFGRTVLAQGRASNAMGELCRAESDGSSVDGYQSIAGKTDPSHPNYAEYGVDGEAGAAARAHGYDSQAYGNFAFAYGAFLRAYNGGQAIGRGIADAPMIISKRGIGFGYNVSIPQLFLADGGRVGFGTQEPINRYDMRFGLSDTASKNIEDTSGNAILASVVNGKSVSGNWLELFKTVISHPNGGTAASNVDAYHNGALLVQLIHGDDSVHLKKGLDVSGIGYSVNGTRVVGGQAAAIANATAGTEIATINAILAALRNHGLIAT